jgi:hypothetical protein
LQAARTSTGSYPHCVELQQKINISLFFEYRLTIDSQHENMGHRTNKQGNEMMQFFNKNAWLILGFSIAALFGAIVFFAVLNSNSLELLIN